LFDDLDLFGASGGGTLGQRLTSMAACGLDGSPEPLRNAVPLSPPNPQSFQCVMA
jgi:hypothetical protein